VNERDLDPTRMRLLPGDPTRAVVPGVGTIRDVHLEAECAGRPIPCAVHRPSSHHMRTWAIGWSPKTSQVLRVCPAHLLPHPDPDDAFYRRWLGRDEDLVHQCCGCCQPPSVYEVVDAGDRAGLYWGRDAAEVDAEILRRRYGDPGWPMEVVETTIALKPRRSDGSL
jgi:hypothetical protein